MVGESFKAIRKLSLTAVGLAQSVERLTAERQVAGSIPGTGPTRRVFNWEMEVLPLPGKWLDLRVAQMTT